MADYVKTPASCYLCGAMTRIRLKGRMLARCADCGSVMGNASNLVIVHIRRRLGAGESLTQQQVEEIAGSMLSYVTRALRAGTAHSDVDRHMRSLL